MSEGRVDEVRPKGSVLRYFFLFLAIVAVLHLVLLLELSRNLESPGDAFTRALQLSPHDRLIGLVIVVISVAFAAEVAKARRGLMTYLLRSASLVALCSLATAGFLKLSESKFVATGYPLVDFYILSGGGGFVTGLMLYVFFRFFFWLFPKA